MSDNIFIQRFWRTVKYEEDYLKDYKDVLEAVSNLKAILLLPSRTSASRLGLSNAGGDLLWESERVKGAGEGTKGGRL